MVHESCIGCWVFVLFTCVVFGVKDRTDMQTSLNYFQMNVIIYAYMNTYYRTM